jgi:two-component system, chemotaxis family, CheB/CheR fusion protein
MWVGVTTDITEQIKTRNLNLHTYELHSKELEEKVQQRTAELSESNELLRQRNDELGKMNKELESFTYISSHDLQEPLRKIQTFAGILLQKETEHLSAKGKDYFKRMQDAANRMQQLILDLLSFSRISTVDRKFEKINLEIIIDTLKTSFKEELQEKNASIEARGLCEINIVPFQFEQLFQNLISNSLKFSQPGLPPHMTINAKIEHGSQINNHRLAPKKEYCHISFTDNGIGFEPQYHEQIFEVFQRLHAREDYSGTGIGLAIVKKIVENHHGIISASSEPGRGARFDIYIPV